MNNKITHRKKPLTSAQPRILNLEARLMFDAAAASDVVAATAYVAAVEVAPVVHVSLPMDEITREVGSVVATGPEVVELGRDAAMTEIQRYLNQPGATERLFELFRGDRSAPDAQWQESLGQLRADILQGTWNIAIQLVSSSTLNGGFGAFSASGTSGSPVIYLNADWMAAAPNADAVARVLLEEFGHAIDAHLNGSKDTMGDEGEAFAATLLGFSADWDRIAAEDDSAIIYIDGREVNVEEASITFGQVWKITPNTPSEETNSFTTDPAALAGTKFRFTSGVPGDPFFSGNNVTGTLSYVDAGGVNRSISGVVSRLVKTGSVVDGFYFYVQGSDGVIGTSDDSAYLFKSGTSFVFAGSTAYNTSSDPVDRALNAQILPNSAPTLANDTGTVLEEGSTSGNVLTNDTDANQDPLRVTSFTVNGVATPVTSTTPGSFVIPGVGNLTMNSTGAYTFAPSANYAGAVPQITYAVTDGTATSTANLALTITAVNDAPTGTNKAVTIAESTQWTFSSADFGFSDSLDVPANSMQSVVLTTLPASGTFRLNGVAVTVGQEILSADITRLVFTPTPNGPTAASFTFQVRDTGGTANGGINLDPIARTFTFNISSVNEAPVAVADVAPAAAEAGGALNATVGIDPSGNVLANDTDADVGDTRTVSVIRSTATGNNASPAVGSTSATSASSVAGLYGTLQIGADGSYKYVVDNSNATVQALRLSAQTLTESFSYTIRDAAGASSGSTLTITITGANDAPIASVDQANAKESIAGSGQYSGSDTSGSLGVGNVLTNDTDVDSTANGESRSVVGLLADATGVTPGAAVTTITVNNVTGVQANDYVFTDPTGAKTPLLNSSGVQVRVVSVDATTNKVTLNDAAVTASLTSGTQLGFTNNANGNGSFVTKSFQSSATSASPSTSVTINSHDGAIVQGMTVTGTGIPAGVTVTSVTYSGTTITGVTLSQAVQLATGSSLNFTIAVGSTVNGAYGTLTIVSSGAFTYTPTANNSALSEGTSQTERFRYQMRDALGITSASLLNITVAGSGTNDPNATNDTATAVEAGGSLNASPGTDPSFSVLTTDTTPAGTGTNAVTAIRPAGATAETSVPSVGSQAVSGLYGTLTISADGTANYVVNNSNLAVQALRTSGSTLTDTFYYRVRNTFGREDVASIIVTVQGANDAPVGVGDVNSAQAAGGITATTAPVGNVLSNDLDVDSGDTKTVTRADVGAAAPVTAVTSGTAVAGLYGTLTISGNGAYSYTVDSMNAAVRALAGGATLSEVFSYELSDSAGLLSTSTLTITVVGANDAPVNTAPGTHTQFDYQTSTVIPGISVNDADGDLTSVTVSVGSGTLAVGGGAALTGVTGNGTDTLAISGTQAYINGLLAGLSYSANVGFRGIDTLRLSSIDATGLTDLDTVEITVGPDNRAVAVSSQTVNEGSPYIVFSVSGAAGQQLSLLLATTGNTAGHATAGLDFGSFLEIWNGSNWVVYTGGMAALDGSGSLLVRTTVAQDNVSEGAETMTLVARNAADTATASGGTAGTGTIVDDGSGVKYSGVVVGGIPVTSTASLDDDRALTIADISVNEGAGHAVFTVSGANGQLVTLSLRDGTAGSTDYGTAIEVYDAVASSWVAYGGSFALPAGGSVQVRTTITNDALFESSETFALVAANVGGIEFLGTARILDDGTGSGGNDDDRVVTVSSPTVNEGSPTAVFTVGGTAGQSVTLVLTGGSATAGGTDFGSATANNLQVSTDGGASWVNYTGAVTIPAGGSLLARTPLNDDSISDNNETFTLTATPLGGTAAVGTATVKDDGTGTVFTPGGVPDPTAVPSDDRIVTVSSPTVNEGSPTAVFTVGGTAGQSVTLVLTGGSATAGGTDFGSSTANNLQVSTDGGVTWMNYTGAVTIPAGGSLLARTPLNDDGVSDNNETFTLTATVGGTSGSGTATVKDDGTGTVFTPGGLPDPTAVPSDDRPVTVTSPTVNEGSPTAVFTVGGTAGQSVTLVLTGGSATAGGTDFGSGTANNLQVSTDGGASWVNYTGAVTIPAGGSLLARTPLNDDSISDNNETFTLTATPLGGTAAVGTATVKDDGTGTVFTPGGVPDPTTVPSDDRIVTVSSPTVNEGSPTAVFTVGGTAGQSVTLVLTGGSATAGGTDFGSSTANNLQVSTDGGVTWMNYTGAVTIPAGGSLLARTPLNDDGVSDNNETFTLTATVGGTSGSGTATVKDDGTGTVFTPGGLPDPTAVPSDDRPVTVTSPTVNEGSPTAVFTVGGTAGQSVTLVLTGGSATAGGTDFGSGTANNLQVSTDGGASWVNYTGAVTIPAGGSLLARTPLNDDSISDNNETFTLTATPLGGTAAVGTATVKDDGTGTVFTPGGVPDPTAVPSDDRIVTVSSPTVNEGSPTAVFTVGGTAGQSVTLVLTGGSATAGGTDFGSSTANNLQVSTDGGVTWMNYTGAVTIPAGGSLLARTPLNDDGVSDNNETFTLTATVGGTSGSGTATVKDDGTGTVFTPGGLPDPTAVPSDDRPVTVTSPTVNEGSPTAVFTVGGTAGQSVTLVLTGGSATAGGTDFGSGTANNLQVSTDGGASWVNYTGAVTIPAGGSLLARTPLNDDSISDNNETFTLTATPLGGTAAVGTATVKDDGTGTVFTPGGVPDPTAVPSDDRIVTVSSPTVNEGSPTAVFTVGGTAGQSVTLVLTGGSATAGGTDFGSSTANNLQVSTDGGVTWMNYTGAVTIPAGGSLLARTPLNDDGVSDNNETFTLTATVGGTSGSGTATVKDDGTGTVFTPGGLPDPTAVPSDDRPVTVTSPTVNEGSPTAVFTVGGTAGQSVTLVLTGGSATAGGTDFGSGTANNLQVSTDGGASWVNYTGAVTIPAGGSLLARTPLNDDSISDNNETFTLTATPLGGTAAVGTATVKDDGTGTVFTPGGVPDPTAVPSDDRIVTVSSPTVNEGSPTAVFTVGGTAGQSVTLVLTGGSATAGGTDFGSSTANNLQVSTDGGVTWMNYTGAVTIPAGGSLLARTPLNDDGVSDNNETFTLTATVGGTSGSGTATVKDDGTGTVFTPGGVPDPTAVPSDDRPVTVSSPRVNEASPFAVFTVQGGANQQVQLSLGAGTADGSDYGGANTSQPVIEFYGPAGWTVYVPGTVVQLDTAGRMLVRTAITADKLNEGDHTFALSVKTASGVDYRGTATINDQGEGDIFLGGGTTGAPSLTTEPGYPVLDDDRPQQDAAIMPMPEPVQVADTVLDSTTVDPLPAQINGPAQQFDSAMGFPGFASLGELRSLIEDRSDAERYGNISADLRDVDDIYTRASGFRTVVVKASEGALRLFRGVEDQIVPVSKVLNLQVPADAFLHTDANETVTLRATMMDGTPLPAWLKFDSKAGTFTGRPPQDRPLDLRIKVTARDSFGREATTIFRVKAETRGGLTSHLERGEAFAATHRGFQLQRTGR